MIHSFQSHIETFPVIQTVPADWSDLTICTDEILDSPHVLSEANVLESVHVVHKPVGGQSVPVHRAFCAATAAVFPHGWQEQLFLFKHGHPRAEHLASAALTHHRLAVLAVL